MIAESVLLERVVINAMPGLRFWDWTTERVIGDGLRVSAMQFIAPERSVPNKPKRIVPGEPNRSGVYVFQRLPGLGAAPYIEDRKDLVSLIEKGPHPWLFVIDVRDERSRFLPFQFTVDLTKCGDEPGKIPWLCFNAEELTAKIAELFSDVDSPADPPRPIPLIPLFSAPTRTAPVGLAVVRAELLEANSDDSVRIGAAYAVLTVAFSDDSPVGQESLEYTGIADEEGRVAVIFPYPESPAQSMDSPIDSPVDATPNQLTAPSWGVTLSVRYGDPEDADLPPVDPDVPMNLLRTVEQIPAKLSYPEHNISGVDSIPFTLAQGLGLIDEESNKPITPVLIVGSPDSPP